MDTLTKLYLPKDDEYYSSTRAEILPLLPKSADQVLEIGCGEGNTLQWIKETLNPNWIGGVELMEETAAFARGKLDWVCQGNIEKIELPFSENSIELILCLDVLEHLVDPWATITMLTKLLSPGGSLIVSVPNIRHHSVIIPLMFKGEWEYTNKDILDKTHLRFFTKKTAIEIIQSSGLRVQEVLSHDLAAGSKCWIFNIITFGLLRQFLDFQYFIKATKT